MAFDSLSNRLSLAFKNIAGNGKLTEKNMDRMLKEVRTALLEADVNYQVVKKFIEKFNSVGIKSRVYAFSNEAYQKADGSVKRKYRYHRVLQAYHTV